MIDQSENNPTSSVRAIIRLCQCPEGHFVYFSGAVLTAGSLGTGITNAVYMRFDDLQATTEF